MKTWQAITFLCLVWASIYLTHLGSLELRGEEARRILPAQEMLETGDWIVPRIAGEVYANKPPLINWLVAASFALTGSQSEWAARLPSPVALLAVGLVCLFTLRPRLGTNRALYVGLVLITCLAVIDKSLTVEIEATYLALFGAGCMLWISFWSEKRSPWLIWTVPYLLLGLGCLAKGPVHLLFWGLFLVGTFRASGGWRQLLHPAHFTGLAILAAVFVPWMFLNVSSVESHDDSVGNWVAELVRRIELKDVEWDRWALRPFQILGDYLPWTVPLAYTLWQKRRISLRDRPGNRWDAAASGALFAVAFGCLVILLLPRGAPRYVMPLYPLACFALIDLFFRLPQSAVENYQRFAWRSLLILAPLLGLASVGVAVATVAEGIAPPWILVSIGVVLCGIVTWAIHRPLRERSFFLHTPLVIATGFIALFSALLPLQTRNDFIRRAGHEIGEAEGHIVFHADERFRNSHTQHLRLLFYIREPFTAVGESAPYPKDAAHVIGLKTQEKAIREKLGHRKILGQHTIWIDSKPFLMFDLEPGP